ncbi:hypothetical protein [Mycolicibacterium sp.]|uniref:DUF7340 domain-containing protein n=1 Tax=Mycolicibacterium sp. TaxID=2320850 RepID=UPI0037C6D7EE
MSQPIETDGNLPAARNKLSNAISALIDPKPTHRQLDDGTNRIEWMDSLYDQLTDAVPGRTISCDTPIAVIRLQAVERRTWRPQDTTLVESIAAEIEAWATEIRSLLDPVKRWTLPNPCPACDTAIVYRRNSANETVRQPALQIGPNGCVCQNCHHTWAPEYFQHLAQVLGYELPSGVLE